MKPVPATPAKAGPSEGHLPPDMRAIVDSLPLAVLVVDGAGAIRFANSGAEAVFGTSTQYLMRNTLAHFLPFGSPVLQLPEQAVKQRVPIVEYKIDISSPRTGADRIVDVHASPIHEAEGMVVMTFKERSVADRIDRQLTHRGAARSVTGLAAMLAHEIKNPLSGIRGAAQLLEGSASREDKELTRLITVETDRIVKLVDRMEVFSDETPIEPAPVNMHVVLEHVKQLAKAGFGSHVCFTEQYDPSLPPVAGDHDQLVQVFLNLMKNACEVLQSTDGGVIHLQSAYRPGFRLISPNSTERAALPLEFTITDNGPGIDEGIRAHVFEPFVSSRASGVGLGLALVAKIIGSHGGTVECETLDQGTRFRVLLPAWRGTVETEGEPS